VPIPTVHIKDGPVTPDGVALERGHIVVELSQPGKVFDGAEWKYVLACVVRPFGPAGVAPTNLDLVPNDVIDPPGTLYRATIEGATFDGVPYHSPTPELWQLASAPDQIAFADIQRVLGAPPTVYGPDPQTLAARDAAAASAAEAEAAAASLAIDGGAPSSTYGGTTATDGGTP
jgi:hypothetical protein